MKDPDSKKDWDPQVRAAMTEILEVCRKYDLAAHVLLFRNNGWIETRLRLPKWSVLQADKENQDGTMGCKIERKGHTPEDVIATIKLLQVILSELGGMADSAGGILKMLKDSGLPIGYFDEKRGPSAPRWDFT